MQETQRTNHFSVSHREKQSPRSFNLQRITRFRRLSHSIFINALACVFSFQGITRRLLQVNESELELGRVQPRHQDNCTPPSIKEFPSDGFTRAQRQSGYLIIHIVVAIYAFLLLAIVCDDFFVPSITKICESESFFPPAFRVTISWIVIDGQM